MMYSFGKEKRGYVGKPSNPGPGNYESVNKNSIYRSSPNHKIGTGDRLTIKKSDIPGPGTYDNYTNTGVQYSFGGKYGGKNSKNYATPGPGSYESSYPSKQQGPSYTLGGKKYQKNLNNNTPGPGEYEYKSTVEGVPTAKLGNSKRQGFTTKATPGPGAYGDSFRPFSANSQGGRFGTAKRMTDNKNDKYKSSYAPGPGAYEYPSEINPNKGISMGIRKGDLYEKEKSKIPGPGAYDANKIVPKKNICIGSASQRQPIKDNNIPGPGAYEKGFTDKKSAPACRMGTSNRRPLSAVQDTPGPGNYNYQEKIAEGPKYHFGAKQREEESNEYHQSFKPGPGQYQPDYNMTQQKQSTFAFGRETRDKQLKNDAPGPGQYDTRKKIEGPQFGFGSAPREQKIRSDDPGPGAYEQQGTIGKVPKYLMPNGSKIK